MKKKLVFFYLVLAALIFLPAVSNAADDPNREEKKKQEMDDFQKRFEWWPTDAQPAPVKDAQRGGYWWWPSQPGQARPWGNRGYVYVYKIIYDYKAEELPPPQPQELRASLLVKKILKNVKVYFDYNKSALRDDTVKILTDAAGTLRRNPETDILITGNCDRRGSESYNEKLGRRRAEAVEKFMLESGLDAERIRIVSRGKLDAIAPVTDLVGMQKDRNAQFMIAEVEEVMIPAPGEPDIPEARKIEEGKYLVEEETKVEGEVKVSTREYVVKKGDSLWKIAKAQLGDGRRWKYLYELNKDRIKNPDKLKAGTRIIIPVE
ncbi:MAG: OmpA family protein [Candidatus Omnitrophota bacterium]|jgi:outer membrane protein OmpA-like peptidoglycan-associated protein